MTQAIETMGLTKRFLRHQTVRGIDLVAPRCAALALVGSNGAGKTTLLKMLVNLLRPDSGSARVLGKDSRALRAADFQHIGYVSENQRLPEGLTVAQYFNYLRPLYRDWDAELESRLRRQLALPPERKLGKLSHGMRVKAMLIGALSFRPSLLVLDEPLNGLDPLMRDEVLEGLIGQIDDLTILISSQELAEIEGFATHVAYMEDGRLRFQERIEDLAGRFRRVSVTLADDGYPPADPPDTWLGLELSGHCLEFIDSGFVDDRRLSATLSRHLGPVHGFETQPLTLRETSKALMRAARGEVLQ